MKMTRRFYPKAGLDDFLGLEMWLEEKAREGWLLDKIGGGLGWRFRQELPAKKVTYSVVCDPQADALDPKPSEEQMIFRDFCAHAGWILAGTIGEIHVFYSLEKDPTPIETEPAIQLENIHRTVKKNSLIGGRWNLITSLALLALFLVSTQTNPIGVCSSPLQLFCGACWLVSGLFLLTEAVSYRLWYRRARERAETGLPLPPREKQYFTRLYSCLSLVLLAVGAVLLYQAGMVEYMLLILLGFAALGVVCWQMTAEMRREGVPAKTNKRVSAGAGLALGLVLISTIVLVTAADRQRDPAPILPEEGSYAENLDPAALPLSLGDLLGEGQSDPEGSLTWQGTILLSQEEIRQTQLRERLDYRVIRVKFPPLSGPCRRQMLGEHVDGAAYREDNPAPWQAEAAYRLWTGDQPENTYLLFWEDVLVELTASWSLTPRQMEQVGEAFGAE